MFFINFAIIIRTVFSVISGVMEFLWQIFIRNNDGDKLIYEWTSSFHVLFNFLYFIDYTLMEKCRG